MEEMNVFAIAQYMHNVIHINIFFVQGNKIKSIISWVFANIIFESEECLFESNK